MTQYKPYDEYKESGAEWLGLIPTHWTCPALSHVFNRKAISDKPDEQLLSVYRDFGVIVRESRDDNHNKASLDLSPYLYVEPGDLVINKMKAWQGSVGISDYKGIVSPAYFTYRPTHSSNPRYFHHLLRSAIYITGYQASSKGIRVGQWDLDAELFRKFPVLSPPLPEQQAIANFLDRETERIDALIQKKSKFIELLEEKRQALISHAVTKGLNPDAPMKDSGVPWLGEVPAHWEVRKLRYACDAIKTGGTPVTEYLDYPHDDAIEWFTPGDFNDSLSSKKSSRRIGPAASAKQVISIFPAGSVLIVSIGATVGKVLRLYASASANQQINALIPRINVNSDFLFNKMISATDIIRSIATASTLPIINQARLGEIPIAVPSLKEQQQIVEYIQNSVSIMNRLRKSTARSITLLREKRSALITAAVTGQIDVREEVAG